MFLDPMIQGRLTPNPYVRLQKASYTNSGERWHKVV